jgi:hypothetical protein
MKRILHILPWIALGALLVFAGYIAARLTTPTPTAAPAEQQPVAPAAPAEQPAASSYVASINDVPYNLPPQPQIGHPSLYLETGVPCQNTPQGVTCTDVEEHTRHWVIQLLPGTVAVIGGFTVDGVTNGVYKAQVGPGTLDTTVTDGFIAITRAEWANAEFCFRIAQAVQFGWAHAHVEPLAGWTCH